ncbi:phosphoglycerate mutase [Bacillus solimangrovi]|uniref:Phosphoglycerate mutase n=1 Tax=Bacillus solimangrovi TaxID=1305675 RepID=A0A1E5LJY2_9BACI|nr:histidine phosphatase family protein [Bacillus solimangrovi]OEH94397.1 phosphoglycerate mutase [Bacillus solimangrovi]
MKKIYIIRHCEAEGQHSEAQLTEKGFAQSLQLSDFFSSTPIDQIISSPYKRAIQSVQPLAKRLHIEIDFNNLLTERVLSTNNLTDWLEKLKATYDDLELKFEGGESSQEAMERIVTVVEEVFNSEYENIIIVTHGNIMSLLLKYYNDNFGFDEWKNLSNPDIYLLQNQDNNVSFERLWNQ